MNFLFLTPLAFLGLLALGIPIYLHMRHRPRAISYRFSAMNFLLQARKKRQRRVRVEQLLLMLLRLAVLAVLVFLFARPFTQSEKIRALARKPTLYILDDSASMLAQTGGRTIFQQAIQLMEDQTEHLAPDHRVFLFLASDPSRYSSIHQVSELRSLLPKLKATCRHATLDNAYLAALDVVSREKLDSAQLEILSDHRRNTWNSLPPEPGSHVQVHLNQFQVPGENAGFTGIKPANSRHGTSEYALEIMNTSARRRSLDLRIKMAKQEWKERIPLAPDAPTSHRFTLPEKPENTDSPAFLSFDLPPDEFTLDDHQTRPVIGLKKPHILLVDGDPNPILEQSESYYLGLVLQTTHPDTMKRVSAAGLTRDRLNWADLIFLLNVDDPPEKILSEALARGKGILIACGSRITSKAWNPFLKNAGIAFWEWNTLPEPARPALPADKTEPGFTGDFLSSTRFQLYFGDALIEKNQVTTVESPVLKPFLNLEDGSPLLLGGEVQEGRLMILTTALDLNGSNLPIQPGFVPLIESIIDYLFFAERKVEVEQMSVSEFLEHTPINPVLTRNWTHLREDAVSGPLPGMYRWNLKNGETRYGAISLDPEESDFRGTLTENQGTGNETPLPASFKKTQRTDLGHSTAWLLFFLILAETFLAAKTSAKWGGR